MHSYRKMDEKRQKEIERASPSLWQGIYFFHNSKQHSQIKKTESLEEKAIDFPKAFGLEWLVVLCLRVRIIAKNTLKPDDNPVVKNKRPNLSNMKSPPQPAKRTLVINKIKCNKEFEILIKV